MAEFQVQANNRTSPTAAYSNTHRRTIAEMVTNGSLELSGASHNIAELAELLPYGMSVYVPTLPKRSLLSITDTLRELHRSGFNPVPHIAARRTVSRGELSEFLNIAINECGVHRVLLIGGDLKQSLGPYEDAIQILKEGILADAGISEVGLAGYPEGHPRIPLAQLEKALHEKIQLVKSSGMGASIVTQFSFVPGRITQYCMQLAMEVPEVPVYIGVPGPTNPIQLMKYARICGVGSAVQALADMGFKAARLAVHTDPSEQLEVITHYAETHAMQNIIGVHVFSFGGSLSASRWLLGKLDHG